MSLRPHHGRPSAKCLQPECPGISRLIAAFTKTRCCQTWVIFALLCSCPFSLSTLKGGNARQLLARTTKCFCAVYFGSVCIQQQRRPNQAFDGRPGRAARMCPARSPAESLQPGQSRTPAAVRSGGSWSHFRRVRQPCATCLAEGALIHFFQQASELLPAFHRGKCLCVQAPGFAAS